MTPSSDELVTESEELSIQAGGAGARFEDACRRTAARDLRGRRRQDAEAFFDGVAKVLDEAKAATTDPKERQKLEYVVYLVHGGGEGEPRFVQPSAQGVEPKKMKEAVEAKEAYALPEQMFWDFAEWFKDGIHNGTFDAKVVPGESVAELAYAEFRGASRSWLERKGWHGVLAILDGAS